MYDFLLNRAWAEINLDNISKNVLALKQKINRNTEIMGVVKADAYGHGIRETVPVLIESGVTRLAVSMLDEAIELRKNNVNIPILVLSYTDPRRAEEIIENRITQTVYSIDLAKALSDAGKKLKKEVRIHIKTDTGMGRVGFMSGFGAVKNIIEINNMDNIVIEGLYTHFSCADEDEETYTVQQFEKFMSICNELGRLGLQIPIKHVCNSAAAIKYPHMNLDMVRIGILLYGINPGKSIDVSNMGFKPSMSLKSNVILVKNVEPNTGISYSKSFITKRPSVIATIPIGYADGYLRNLSGKAKVLIGGQYFPVVGNICMDSCMVDITDAGDGLCVKVGDEVVLFGNQIGQNIPVDEIAGLMDTINYEVVCLIGKRVPRVYIRNNKILKVQNYLIG